MHKALFRLLFCLTLLVMSFPTTAHAAYLIGPCGPYQQPAPGAPCRDPYIGGELIHLATGVSSGWLRSTPSSTAPVVATVSSTRYANLQIVTTQGPDYAPISAWDGTQRWYKVHLYPLNRDTAGWIEQASFATITASGYPPEDPTTNAGWHGAQTVRVKPGFPFVWMRRDPSSTGPVVATVFANDTMTLLGSSTFDGIQWWWQVNHGQTTGWVEQAGLIVGNNPDINEPSQGNISYPPDDPATLAPWSPPLQMRVKPEVPFLWLRGDPSSTGCILATATSLSRLTLRDGPVFDDVQWWWKVSNGQTTGWVEQSHLVAIQP